MDLPVDWSNPQKDILELIFECLKDPSDVLHCHGVCRSWYSVARHFSRQHLQNLPPLIMFSETIQMNYESSSSSSNSTSDREIVFYNCHSRRRYSFSFPPDLHESWLSGGPHGWIISTQRKKPDKICLMNAVSHALIRLPNANSTRNINKLRLIMSANPSSDPNCTFLSVSRFGKYFAICRLGDTNWRKLAAQDLSDWTDWTDYGAATFYDGHFYVYYRGGIILKIDVSNCQVSKLFTETEGPGRQESRDSNTTTTRDDYLMESTGELLLISKCFRRTGVTAETEIKVYKLDHERNIWVEVEDLGNRALFVGYNNSNTVVVPETNGGEYGSRFGRSTVCRANCIYFIDDSDCVVENNSGGERSRGVYDMNTREYKGWITGLRPIWFNAPLSWIRPEV